MKSINLSTIIMLMGLFLASNIYAQNSSVNWQIKMQCPKVIIENQGQFPVNKTSAINGSEVLYAIEDGKTMVYFTRWGIYYEICQTQRKYRKEEISKMNFSSHAEKERTEKILKITSDLVQMKWKNANPEVEIIAGELADEYFSYSFYNSEGELKNINFIKAYKKIVYKNIYPAIDVEYSLHPADGFKYSLILHPGADLSQINMEFSCEPKLSPDGNLHINTKFGDILEHAPVSFFTGDEKNRIQSEFEVEGNLVKFKLHHYNNSHTVTIDPWVQTPALPNSNGVWEIECDAAGNIYAIGGDMPMKLIKYTSAGIPVWTYNTPYDTSNSWLGTFITDSIGNCYITSGSLAAMQKISPTATLLWNYTPGIFNADEYWAMAFNCHEQKLAVGGTWGIGFQASDYRGAIFDIDMNNGAINGLIKVASGYIPPPLPIIQEVRTITHAPNMRYYFLTPDTLGFVGEDFASNPNATFYKTAHNYSLGYKCENFRPKNGNGGIKAIKASGEYLYTMNGAKLEKRSLNDCSILSSVNIPGGISVAVPNNRYQLGNCGIDIDACGNLYVGSGNAILKYDKHLNLLDSVMLPFKVYDVAVHPSGDIVFCGADGNNSIPFRTGYIQSVSMNSCGILPTYIPMIIPVDTVCSNAIITLTASIAGGTWSGPGIIDSTAGTFNPAIAGPGTHVIKYTLPCGTDSTVIFVKPLPVSNAGTDQGMCPGSTVQLAGYGTGSCSWYPASGLSATNIFNPLASPSVTTVYTLTVTGTNGCWATDDVTVYVQTPDPSQEICLVSVDTALNKNVIYWVKNTGVGTYYYYLYYEVMPNIFNWMGMVSYDDPPVFIDYASNPNSSDEKYRIQVFDTCMALSLTSPYHKTIYLEASTSGLNAVLNWTPYFDESGHFIPGKYYIYKGLTISGLQLIDSVPGSVTSYTDYGASGYYYYMVAVKRTPGCTGGPVSYSLSNINNNGGMGMNEWFAGQPFHMYPNPAETFVTIETPNPDHTNYLLTIFEITGKTIYSDNFSENRITLDVSSFSSGVYLVQLNGKGFFNGRLIILKTE